jgi:hypothetical protein
MRRALWLVALAACAHTTPPPANGNGLWYGDLHAVAQEAARVRGVQLTKEFDIVELDDAAFEEAALADDPDEASRRARKGAAFQQSFRPDEPLAPLKGSLAARSLHALGAFYSPRTHRILVRSSLPGWLESDPDAIAITLAHECWHVLQDQLGLIEPFTDASTLEADTVKSALWEGDAMLTGMLVVAARHGIPPQVLVGKRRDQLRDETPLRQELKAKEMFAGERDTLLLKYFTSERFAYDLYLAGGLELVDAVMKRPPDRSDAMFQPQRWLDGSDGRLVAPPGARHAGAFALRVQLDAVLEVQRKRGVPMPDDLDESVPLIAEAYRDDAYFIEDGALVWVTAWDEKSVPPTAVLKFLGLAAGWDPRAFATATFGGNVALVAGGSDEHRQARAQVAARMTRAEASPPPFGRRHIPIRP